MTPTKPTPVYGAQEPVVPTLIDWDDAHETAWQAAAAFQAPYFSTNFRAHNWIVEAIRSAHIDGQRFAQGLPKIQRGIGGELPQELRKQSTQSNLHEIFQAANLAVDTFLYATADKEYHKQSILRLADALQAHQQQTIGAVLSASRGAAKDAPDTLALLRLLFGGDVLMNNSTGRYLSDHIEELIASRIAAATPAAAPGYVSAPSPAEDKDGARYRWLRANREAQAADGTIRDVYDEDGTMLWHEWLDAAIDWALAQEGAKV